MKIGDIVKIKGSSKIGIVHEVREDYVKVAISTPSGVQIIEFIKTAVSIITILDLAYQVIAPIVKKYWRMIFKKK